MATKQTEKTTKLKLPSVLTFTGSIKPSSAVFYSTDFNPSLLEKDRDSFLKTTTGMVTTIEGTKTVFSDYKNSKEGVKNLGASNLHRVEQAVISKGNNALYTSFSVTINPKWQKINSLDNAGYDWLKIYNKFKEEILEHPTVLKNLAKKYTTQIFNASWLHRNNEISANTKIYVSDYGSEKFKHLTFEEVEALIYFGLSNQEEKSVCLVVEALVKAPELTRVYPSQIFTESKNDVKKEDVISGLLYKVNGFAALSPQKISCALRKFDICEHDGFQKAIPVGTLGVDQEYGYASRVVNEKTFYHYFLELDTLIKNHNEQVLEYVVACLILGGVFNGESEKNK